MTNENEELFTILLVEDNPGDVRLIEEAFSEVNFNPTVHTAPTWSDALEFLTDRVNAESTAYPDLLLLDLHLPRSSGFAVIRTLNDDPKFPPRPILLLTTSNDEADVRRGYDLGASAYIEKPSDPAEYVSLAQAVKDFWFGQAHFPPG